MSYCLLFCLQTNIIKHKISPEPKQAMKIRLVKIYARIVVLCDIKRKQNNMAETLTLMLADNKDWRSKFKCKLHCDTKIFGGIAAKINSGLLMSVDLFS